jgi:hypothetical protein
MVLMFIPDAMNYFSGGYFFQEQGYNSNEPLIKELTQHASCKSLIEEAQKALQESGLPPLEVRIEPTKSGFETEKEDNVIRIRPGFSANKQRTLFIFELTNIIHHKEYIDTKKNAIKGIYKDEEEYVQAMEFIEYKGMMRTNVVTRSLNKQNGRFFRPYIENPWESVLVENMDFNLYYGSYLPTEHKEFYRREWREWRALNNSSVRENTSTEWLNNALKTALCVSGLAFAFLKWR